MKFLVLPSSDGDDYKLVLFTELLEEDGLYWDISLLTELLSKENLTMKNLAFLYALMKKYFLQEDGSKNSEYFYIDYDKISQVSGLKKSTIMNFVYKLSKAGILQNAKKNLPIYRWNSKFLNKIKVVNQTLKAILDNGEEKTLSIRILTLRTKSAQSK